MLVIQCIELLELVQGSSYLGSSSLTEVQALVEFRSAYIDKLTLFCYEMVFLSLYCHKF